MKRNLIFIAALVTLTLPAVCSAAPARPGAYVSVFAGVSGVMHTDATTNDFVNGGTFNERVEFDPNINIGGTGGFDFGVVRLEGEISYKHGEISSVSSQDVVTGATSQIVDTDGSLGALAMMFNGFFDLHNASPVTPYFGGGIGFAALHLTDTFGTNISGVAPTRGLVYADDDDTVFAYQAGAGLEIALTRQLSLDLGYRYFATSEAHFNSTPITTNMKFESHNGAVGLRMKF